LVDGNATPGGAFYAGEVVGAQLAGSAVSNITGAAGLTIYYDPALAGNAYLGGTAYDLTTGGSLVPLGTPPVPLLGLLARLALTMGLLGLAWPATLWRRRLGVASRSMQPARHTGSERRGRATPWQ